MSPSTRLRCWAYARSTLVSACLGGSVPMPTLVGRSSPALSVQRTVSTSCCATRLGLGGAAFSASDVFGSFGLADDEPFGPDWGGLHDQAAKKLLVEDVSANIENAASALGIKVAPVALPPLTPATKLVVAGGAAVVAVARAFVDDRALSWSDQVLAVAARAAVRQLAGLAAVIVGARSRTAMIRPESDAASAIRAAGFAHLDAVVVSSDAEPEAADFASKLGSK